MQLQKSTIFRRVLSKSSKYDKFCYIVVEIQRNIRSYINKVNLNFLTEKSLSVHKTLRLSKFFENNAK